MMERQSRKTITGLLLSLQLLALLVLSGATSRLAAAEPLQWIGNTFHWPGNNEIDPTDDLWIGCQTWPAGSATNVSVVYTVDGGTSWFAVALSDDGQEGNNDKWLVNLGAFPAATGIRYAMVATDAEGNEFWDNKGGGDYTALVAPLQIVQTPDNADLTRHDDLVIVFDAPGAGSGYASVEVFYSLDDTNWTTVPMERTPQMGYDHWEANLGKFLDATVLRYALAGIDAGGDWHWLDNRGELFTAIVDGEFENLIPMPAPSGSITQSSSLNNNPRYSALYAFDYWRKSFWYSGSAAPAWVAYDFGKPTRIDQYAIIAASDIATSAPRDFELQGTNGGEWVTLDAQYDQSGWSHINPPSTYMVRDRGEYSKYRLLITRVSNPELEDIRLAELQLKRAPEVLVGHSPANGILTCGDDLVVSLDASGSARGYASVEVVYTKDGSNWLVAPLELTAETGYDHWGANLGEFDDASEILYALVATDAEGNQQWFNNGGENYTAHLAGAYVNQVVPLSGPGPNVTGQGTWSYSDAYLEWHAFDGWSGPTTNQAGGPHYWGATSSSYQAAWIGYEFSEAIRIDRYTITYNASDSSDILMDFELQGANGDEWVTLDARSGETGVALFSEPRSYRVADPGEYLKYRLYIPNNLSSGAVSIQIGELELEQLTDISCSN